MNKKKTLKRRDETNYSPKIFIELKKKEHDTISFETIDSTEKNKNSKWSYSNFVFDK